MRLAKLEIDARHGRVAITLVKALVSFRKLAGIQPFVWREVRLVGKSCIADNLDPCIVWSSQHTEIIAFCTA